MVAVWLSGSDQLSYSMPSQISTWMGDRAWGSTPGAENLSQYTTSHQGQLNLAIPTWVGAMSTGQRAVMLCSWEVKAGRVCVWVADHCVIPS